MNTCELILNVVIPLFIFLCFDQSISAWSSVGAFSFAVFMLLDEQSIVRARGEVHLSYCCPCPSVHHCVIRTETHSPSRHFSLIFIFWEEICLKLVERERVGLNPCQLLSLAECWLNLSSDVRLTHSSLHHSIFTETHNTQLWCIPSCPQSVWWCRPGKHSPSWPDRLNLRLYIYGNVWMSNLCSISSSAFHLSIYFSILKR